MKVSDILLLEGENTDSIYLLKEGIFWRAYNQSAMRLCNCLQPYKVNVKYIKNVKQDIYYCGFPNTYLDKITQKAKDKGYEAVRINEKQLSIKNIPNDSIGYDEWKIKHNSSSSGIDPSVEYQGEKGVTEAIKRIREFPLEKSTPIQTLLFVQQLKQMIKVESS